MKTRMNMNVKNRIRDRYNISFNQLAVDKDYSTVQPIPEFPKILFRDCRANKIRKKCGRNFFVIYDWYLLISRRNPINICAKSCEKPQFSTEI